MHRPIHFEVPADDPARAQRFYSQALGWSFEPWAGPMPYWMVKTGEGSGIDGGLCPRGDGFGAPRFVVDVADIDAAGQAVAAAGGRTVTPKTPVPGVGWTLYAADTEGNIFGMMQFDPEAA